MGDHSDDSEDFHRREREAWDSVSAGWDRWFGVMESGAQSLNERLVALAGIEPGQRVLDVATGLGEPAATAARAAGPHGRVLGIDLSPQMLAHARQRVARLGLDNLEFAERDAEQLSAAEGPFDAAVCRWGLMLMQRPAVVARAIGRVLKPGGRFAAAVWGAPDEVPFIAMPQRVVRDVLGLPPADPDEPGPCRLGQRGQLEAVLDEAGFGGVESYEETVTFSFASPAEFVSFLGDMSSSLRKKTAELPAAQRREVLAAIESAAAAFAVEGGRVELHNRALCAVGTPK